MTDKVLDDDGENLAVRWFLALYGGTNSLTVEQMRDHLCSGTCEEARLDLRARPRRRRRRLSGLSMYATISFGIRSKRAWVKIEDGKIVDASSAFMWSIGKPRRELEDWLTRKGLSLSELHGNVKNVKHYL